MCALLVCEKVCVDAYCEYVCALLVYERVCICALSVSVCIVREGLYCV